MGSKGVAMTYYGPETLILLRNALDEAWAALPDGTKSKTPKSEMAQRIVRQAADGVRDRVRLRASALISAVGLNPQTEFNCRERDRRKPNPGFKIAEGEESGELRHEATPDQARKDL